MNSVGMFHNALMYAKGFKKIALKDTKGILNKTNNYKWVKETKNTTTTVLPSGTVVQDSYNALGNKSKKVIKPDGKMFFSYRALADKSYVRPMNGFDNIVEYGNSENIGSLLNPQYYPIGAGKFYKSILPEQALKKQDEINASLNNNQLRQKRLKFIEEFNKKFERKDIKGSDGTRSKYVIDRQTGKIVSFWRRNAKGETMSGTISYPMGDAYRELSINSYDGVYHNRSVQNLINKCRVVKGVSLDPCRNNIAESHYSRITTKSGESVDVSQYDY